MCDAPNCTDMPSSVKGLLVSLPDGFEIALCDWRCVLVFASDVVRESRPFDPRKRTRS
jgi:hypothetical protein